MRLRSSIQELGADFRGQHEPEIEVCIARVIESNQAEWEIEYTAEASLLESPRKLYYNIVTLCIKGHLGARPRPVH